MLSCFYNERVIYGFPPEISCRVMPTSEALPENVEGNYLRHLVIESKSLFQGAMGGCCRVLGQECSIRNLGLRFHDARAFTDSPVSRTKFCTRKVLLN